ncbi:lysine--tRNA ligase [Nocardiopsis dassonvillei]
MVSAADQVLAEAKRRGQADAPLVCASGISPSGPIHLGNLREVMVPHFVADELRQKGHTCRHILSWDDYDRMRKVPVGTPDVFAEYIGLPLTSVPDPCGKHPNWAEHFKAPFRAALSELGVEVDEISQTDQYTSGAYQDQVVHAMANRDRIDRVLGRYRTAQANASTDEDGAEVVGGTYFPYKPYCLACGRDTTTVTSFTEQTAQVDYTCQCGFAETFSLNEVNRGKLVWKVDWPMRWAYENVTFEAGGVDHSSPGSSFTVGSQLVRDVFDAHPPTYLGYAFVGTSGAAKMSGSTGGAPTPADALEILEAPVLRWLYGRRRPNQSITVSFGTETGRLYDEWDALGRRVADSSAQESERQAYRRATTTATRSLPQTPRPLPFKMLASVLDITTGDPEQTLRILGDISADQATVASLDEVRPRLDRAQVWVDEHLPTEERTRVRQFPDAGKIAQLSERQRQAVKLLLEGLDEHWSLDGLTRLVYGVPKVQAGLALDASPSAELKTVQREFFALLYTLLVGRDTGPRLPTLLLALGRERLRELLPA